MNWRKRIGILMLAAALVLPSAAGCGKKEAKKEETKAKTEETAEEQEQPAEETTEEEPVVEEPEELDPVAAGEKLPVDKNSPMVITSVANVNEAGDLVLSIGPSDLSANGLDERDLVYVKFAGRKYFYLMPIVSGDDQVSWPKDFIDISDGTARIRRKNRSFAEREFLQDCAGKKVKIWLGGKGAYQWFQVNGDLSAYPSPEAFANFRNVKCGNIGDNVLFRGFHPAISSDVYGPRHIITDTMCRDHNIQAILTLSETPNDLEHKMDHENVPYFMSLYENGQVCATYINGETITDEVFRSGMTEQMRFVAEHKGPYFVHCTIGRDRTGFVVALFAALEGANLTDIAEDYVMSWRNYDKVEAGTILDDYMKSGLYDDFIEMEAPEKWTNPRTLDLKSAAERYLKETLGLSDEEVEAIRTNLAEDY